MACTYCCECSLLNNWTATGAINQYLQQRSNNKRNAECLTRCTHTPETATYPQATDRDHSLRARPGFVPTSKPLIINKV